MEFYGVRSHKGGQSMDLEIRETLERVLILARAFVDSHVQVGQENQNAIARIVTWLDNTEILEADPFPLNARRRATPPISLAWAASAYPNRTDDTRPGVSEREH